MSYEDSVKKIATVLSWMSLSSLLVFLLLGVYALADLVF